VVEFVKRDGKTYVRINDYEKLRNLYGQLLAEIQRVKSEGDFEGAKNLVETYAVKVDSTLHAEILQRYEALHLALTRVSSTLYTRLRRTRRVTSPI